MIIPTGLPEETTWQLGQRPEKGGYLYPLHVGFGLAISAGATGATKVVLAQTQHLADDFKNKLDQAMVSPSNSSR